MTEAEFARVLALGQLDAAVRAVVDARDLLNAIEDPRGRDLEFATPWLVRTARSLSQQAADETG